MAWTLSSVRVRAPRIALSAFFTALALALAPLVATAQTVSPRVVEFDPSPDHSRSVNGVEVVDGYELRFYTVAGSQPLHVIEIGKPSPESDGKIRFDFSGLLGAWPVDGVVYEARVAAVGPGGSTTSTVSNQFVFPGTTPPPPCTYSLSTTARSGNAAVASGSIGVTAGTGCAWTASTDSSWLDISTIAGSGNGTVPYSIEANPTTSQRVGRVTINGNVFTYTQAGATCSYSLSPTSRTVDTTATTGSLTLQAGSTCAWTATSSASWLTLSGTTSGSGGATLNYSVATNSASSARSATISAGGATFTLTQNGSCSYTISPTTRTVSSGATTGTIGVDTGSSCTWTPTSSASWLTVTAGGGTTTGDGSISYSVAAHTASAARSATITIGTASFTLTQNGSCVYTVTPTSQGFNPPSGTGTVQVSTSSGCSWTATRSGSWITITSGASGSGNGTVNYRVSSNTGSSSRTGTLTVAGRPVVITQSASTAPTSPVGLRIVTVR